MQIKFNPALLRTQNLLKMWRVLTDWLIKGYQRVQKCSAKFRQCGALG